MTGKNINRICRGATSFTLTTTEIGAQAPQARVVSCSGVPFPKDP